MKRTIVFALIIMLAAFSLQSQIVKPSVRIKILHQKMVLLDTVIYQSGSKAIQSIEQIVSKYSDQSVYIDASNVRELYVFSFENIKRQKATPKPEPIVVNIDSILNSIALKIEKVMTDSAVNAVKDSISHSLKEMKEAIQSIDKQDLKEVREDFSEFIDKVKETRVIIIQEGDTIKIPNK